MCRLDADRLDGYFCYDDELRGDGCIISGQLLHVLVMVRVYGR